MMSSHMNFTVAAPPSHGARAPRPPIAAAHGPGPRYILSIPGAPLGKGGRP